MMQQPVDRRIFLGTTVATVILPKLAFGQQGRDPASQEPTGMNIQMNFNGQTLTATLYDNPSARDFYSMLPLDLTIDNYADNEKITYLPRKLTEDGSGPFGNEQPGDICYFAPWGNLALFYAGYRWSGGLIRLGRFDQGFEPLLTRGKFPLRIERIEQESSMEILRAGSRPSNKGPADWFTGTVRIDPLFNPFDGERVQGAQVTFEPGARTAWHTHPLGQTLVITSGLGRVQVQGGPIEEVRPGDIVWFPPGVKHWHGAAPATAMTHIAVQEIQGGKAVDWMEHVTDAQYAG